MKRSFFLGLLSLTLMASSSVMAKASDIFDMFTVHNETDSTIRYQVRWDDGKWQNACVDPHSAYNHWIEECGRGHNVEIRFDRGDKTGDIHYTLPVNSGTDTSQGASYTFQYSGMYLDLTSDDN